MQVYTLLFFVTLSLVTYTVPALTINTSKPSKSLWKSASISTQSTPVSALGRVADLGDLYDARSDNFVQVSLYTTDLSRSGDAIHSTDNPYASMDYVRTESFSEKMEKLGVEAQLSVSFLGGLVKASGSGKYLNDDKKSAKSAKTSLVYSIRTVTEELKIFSKSSREIIDEYLLSNIDATHVVVGIDWGANVVLSLEETNTDSSNIQEIQGKLEAALNLVVLSVSGSAEVDFGSSDVESSSSFGLHLNGDIIPDTIPQTINESISFIRSIPDLIKKENDGKGKIMNYILMPLSTVQKVFQAESNNSGIVKEISEDLIEQFMRIFQEMKDSELLINDVYDSFNTWNLMIDEEKFPKISDMKGKFDSFTNDLRKSFADQVVLFRGGKTDQQALVDLIDTYQKSNYTLVNVTSFLDEFTETMHKIELLILLQSSNALFVNRRMDKYKILAEKYHEKVKIISVDLSIEVSSPYVHDIIHLLETECVSESTAVTCYIDDIKIDVPEVKVYTEGNVINTLPVNKKEYFFINNEQGIVIIIDANSYELITYYEDPEFVDSSSAIINDTFYNINTDIGVIKSTSMDNIMSKNLTDWSYVGSFPADPGYTKNRAVANGTVIYFTSYHGTLYSYDTVLKTVTHCGNVQGGTRYGSLVMVDNILYIFHYQNFYSFDGITINPITLSDQREYSGLFQLGHSICIVGGNMTNTSPDPVACYDPQEKSWKISSYINEARRFPGMATSQARVHIFGGYSWLQGGELTFSAEVLNINNQKWSYIPSPLSIVQLNTGDYYMQAITFYF